MVEPHESRVTSFPPMSEQRVSEDVPSSEIDDQFRALMEGLRTSIPGVVVLFSFLLVLPLQSPFAEIRTANTVVYYTAFSSSALAAVLLIAPSVHQRIRAPISGIQRRTMSHVMFATKLAIAGTIFFLIAISAVVYLVSSLVFTDLAAGIATAAIVAIAVWAWIYVPLFRFDSTDD